MSDKNNSCMVERVRYYIDISESDEILLRELEKDEKKYKARTKIRFDDKVNYLFVVKSGWLYSYVDLDDKNRQVLRFHYPGDIVGLTDVALQESFSNMITATDVVLCPFPKKHLDKIFTESPRLTALIFSLGMLEQVILMDRLKMIGRSNAVNRLIHFLLEVQARLKIHTYEDVADEFLLPVSQEVIGDAIGLTNVTVSNAFKELAEDGLVNREKKNISIRNREFLKEKVEFYDRYFKIDTSWFPES